MSERPSLPYPAIMLVTDSSRRPREHAGEQWLDDVVRDAVLGGVNVVQLREKHLARGDLIALGLHVRDAVAGRALLFVNGDIEAAVALRADGIHLPEDGPRVRDVRETFGRDALVSAAVHDTESAQLAERDGADLVVAGTVFETASKPGAPLLGVEGLREVCQAVRIPVIGIGGITPANAGDVIRAGAAGVAVIGAIFDAPSPREAASALANACAVAVRR